jgi:hypothetical protein
MDAQLLLRAAAGASERTSPIAPTAPSESDDPQGYPDELDGLLDEVGEAEYGETVRGWIAKQGRTPAAYRQAIGRVRARLQEVRQ